MLNVGASFPLLYPGGLVAGLEKKDKKFPCDIPLDQVVAWRNQMKSNAKQTSETRQKISLFWFEQFPKVPILESPEILPDWLVGDGLLLVERKDGRRRAKLLKDYEEAMAMAKKDHLNMWKDAK